MATVDELAIFLNNFAKVYLAAGRGASGRTLSLSLSWVEIVTVVLQTLFKVFQLVCETLSLLLLSIQFLLALQ